MEDICSRARVRKGSFYHFFPSKADLAAQAWERCWEEQRPLLDDVFSVQRAPLERIRAFCEAVYASQVDLHRRHGRVLGCPYGSTGSEISALDERLRRKASELVERGLRYLEATIAEAAVTGQVKVDDARSAARAIHAYVAGALLEARIHNDPELLRELSVYAFRLIGADAQR